MLCGTEKFPEKYRAKKYKIHQKFLTRDEFRFIMKNLPVSVSEQEIEEMFAIADSDRDDKISYEVNQLNIVLFLNVVFKCNQLGRVSDLLDAIKNIKHNV